MNALNPEWEVHPSQVAEALRDGDDVLLLDVRRQDEWDRVRLPDATLIPLHELEARVEELAARKAKAVIVYCHHGARSLRGAAILRRHGFLNAYSLAGGIDGYSLLVDPSLPRY